MRNNHEFYDTWSQLIWFQPCTSKLFFVTNIWHGVIQKCFLKRKWWRQKFIVKCKQQISEKNSPTHHKIFLADHQGNHLTFFSSAEFLTLQNFSDWEVCRDKNFSNWLSFKISSSEWGKLSSHNNSWILTLEKWPPSANKST